MLLLNLLSLRGKILLKINLKDKIGRGYATFWNFKGRYRVCKGGRGSKKSTTTAMWIIYNMMKMPLANTLVVRQTFNTHLDSTWVQLKWATQQLGVAHLWTFSKSPLKATYNPTGQVILFRGLDDPMSITSITVPIGYLCWCWFEEAYQVKSEDAFDKVDMSIRGELPEGYFKQITLTFNPWSDKHWLKKRFFDEPNDEDKLAITTNYLCNEWLGEDDIKLFNHIQTKFPKRYKVEGLGDWGIIDGLVFDNWKIEEFDHTKIKGELLVGLDFGYVNDPTALICSILDEQNKKLYIFDEHCQKGMLNDAIAQMITNKGYSKSTIIADSAEQKSIEEIKRKGIYRIKPAVKGGGSIVQGIQQLLQYDIIVHPSCEETIKELENYAWDVDKEGTGINKPIDAYNHCIDALRYSLQCVGQKLQTASKSKWGF